MTDDFLDQNSRIPYVHRVNLISDEYYEVRTLHIADDLWSIGHAYVLFPEFILSFPGCQIVLWRQLCRREREQH